MYDVFILQVVKVADFGVARVQTQSGVMTAETGTYRWMAPEVRIFCPFHICQITDFVSFLNCNKNTSLK